MHEAAGVKFATPLLAQTTVPVGAVPLTDAVQIVAELTAAGEGEQATLRVVTPLLAPSFCCP